MPGCGVLALALSGCSGMSPSRVRAGNGRSVSRRRASDLRGSHRRQPRPQRRRPHPTTCAASPPSARLHRHRPGMLGARPERRRRLHHRVAGPRGRPDRHACTARARRATGSPPPAGPKAAPRRPAADRATTPAMALAERGRRSRRPRTSSRWSQPFEDPVPPDARTQGLDLVTLMFNYHDLGHLRRRPRAR